MTPDKTHCFCARCKTQLCWENEELTPSLHDYSTFIYCSEVVPPDWPGQNSAFHLKKKKKILGGFEKNTFWEHHLHLFIRWLWKFSIVPGRGLVRGAVQNAGMRWEQSASGAAFHGSAVIVTAMVLHNDGLLALPDNTSASLQTALSRLGDSAEKHHLWASPSAASICSPTNASPSPSVVCHCHPSPGKSHCAH